jgi:hypothetical protein
MTMAETPAIRLDVQLKRRDDGGLDLRYAVENLWTSDVFLLNGLWTLNAASEFVPDLERVYRFVANDTLTLLFGLAPLPRTRVPFYRNVPCLTRVPAGKSLKFDVAVPGPIAEYNPYFVETPKTTFESVDVPSVVLKLQSLRQRDDLETRPSPFLPGFLELVTPEALAHVETEVSKPLPMPLTVKKRTDEFERG